MGKQDDETMETDQNRQWIPKINVMLLWRWEGTRTACVDEGGPRRRGQGSVRGGRGALGASSLCSTTVSAQPAAAPLGTQPQSPRVSTLAGERGVARSKHREAAV